MPKGVMTRLKAIRVLNRQNIRMKRVQKIQGDFQKTNEAKKQLRLMETSSQTVKKLNAIKPSERKAGHGKELKLAYLKNATSYFSFLEGLLSFARGQNAHPSFIKTIERDLGFAQERIIQAREWNPEH